MIASLLLPLLLQTADPAANVMSEALASAEHEGDLKWNCEDPIYQQEMNYCAGQDYIAADAELNAQWKITVAAMKQRDTDYAPYKHEGDTSPGWFESLLEAQRGWLTYRDGQCRLEGYHARGGSARPLLELGCLAHLTRLRTQELKELVTFPD